jgi:choline dehydrogenase-like flavoprotein
MPTRPATDFDAIVIGSGVTGGWAAKELCESGLKVLMIERGRMVEHIHDYPTERTPPWQVPYRGLGDPVAAKEDFPSFVGRSAISEWNQHFFASERDHPYQTPPERPFVWYRGYQLGGKSLVWGRMCYRWSEMDFEANARDGAGVDWPIRYDDLRPWYDRVETFVGVSGSRENLPQLPDGPFQPPMALNHVEKAFKAKTEEAFPGRKVIIGRVANLTEDLEGRTRCQYRDNCSRGCSFGAYFSTQSATLPAARKTGNLTLLVDTRVVGLEFDAALNRVTGVRTTDKGGKGHGRYTSRLVFLCASTLNSVQILLQSASAAFPNGLGNSSGVLGRYLMDHAQGGVTSLIPGYLDRGYFGSRPTTFYIPRFRNLSEPSPGFVRGYGIQGKAFRANWQQRLSLPGVGSALKARLRSPGAWVLSLGPFAECLPRSSNRVTLDHKHLDPQGQPQLSIDFTWGENEKRLVADGVEECDRMAKAFGGVTLSKEATPAPPGGAAHEMGGARMGRDPRSSVLNAVNQAHDVPNLFVTDGASMSSSACQNPSLTYMALTARACAAAVSMLREGRV